MNIVFDERRESARKEREGPPARSSPRPTANANRSGTLPSGPTGPSGRGGSNGAREYRSRDNNGYDASRNRDRDPRQYNSRDSRDTRRDYSRDNRDGRDSRDSRDNRDMRGPRDRRNDGYDQRSSNSHNFYNSNNSHGSYNRVGRERPQQGPPKSRGPRYNLDDVTPLNELTRGNSLWGVVPGIGYEGASAITAKLSGLFPAPGAPAKNIEAKEVQRILAKFKPKNESNTFEASDKLSPIHSRMSKIVIIDGIDLKTYKANDIKDYVEKLFQRIRLPENESQDVATAGPAKPEEDDESNKPKDIIVKFNLVNNSLILETSKSYYATMLFGLSGTKIEKFGDSTLTVRRPDDYVSFHPPSIKEITPPTESTSDETHATDKTENQVKKNFIYEDADLILVSNISNMSAESEILETLSSIQKVKSIYYPVETESQDGLGFAFCQFEASGNNDDEVLSKISEIVLDDRHLKVSKPCSSRYVQTGLVSSDILTHPVEETTGIITTHDKSKVLEFINCITVADLIDPTKYDDLYDSFKEECSKFGAIEELRIPKPSQDFKIWSSELKQPGLGKVYVQFTNEKDAEAAMNGLAGRLFSGRTVFVRYMSESDFKLEIY